jgi:hypothetical protein
MAKRHKTTSFHFEGFEGFEAPNTTQVPDILFDRLLSHLGEAELKALLYIVRRTFGFKRASDAISFNQFLRGITTRDGRVLDQGCGVRSRTTLSQAVHSLEEKGLVLSEKGVDEKGDNSTTVYRLRFRENARAPQQDEGGVVRNSYHGSAEYAPPVVRKSYPQETGLQETVITSNARRYHATSREIKPANKRTAALDTGRVITELRPIGHVVQGRRRHLSSAHGQEDYQVLRAYMADVIGEFGDRASPRASTTRTLHLLERSGLARDSFIARLYEARSITKDRTASLSTTPGYTGTYPIKNRMAYFFEVLEDLLGLRPQDASE